MAPADASSLLLVGVSLSSPHVQGDDERRRLDSTDHDDVDTGVSIGTVSWAPIVVPVTTRRWTALPSSSGSSIGVVWVPVACRTNECHSSPGFVSVASSLYCVSASCLSSGLRHTSELSLLLARSKAVTCGLYLGERILMSLDAVAVLSLYEDGPSWAYLII